VGNVAQQETAKGPPTFETKRKVIRDFKGMVTKAYRTALNDDEFSRLENLQPVGYGNMRAVKAPSAALVDYAADTIYASQSVNVGGTEYLINFSTTGKAFAFNIATNVSTTIKTGLSGTLTRVAQWKNTIALFIDSTGYYSWDGTTFTTIAGTGVPTSGSDIAVYAGRVWVVSGRVLSFSAADGYTTTDQAGGTSSWASANGSSFVNLTDSTIRNDVKRLFATAEYLYIFAASSINIISDVRVPAGVTPPSPIFTNTNINALIGAVDPLSVVAFGRSILFSNRYGFFQLNGVQVKRLSEDIDQTFNQIDFSQAISAGTCVMSNILIACFLFKWNDPASATARTVIGCNFDNKWYLSFQVASMTLVSTGFLNNVPTLFGFAGNKLYRLFDDANASIATRAETALWDGDDSTLTKQAIRFGIELTLGASASGFMFGVDNEQGFGGSNGLSTVVSPVTWVNNSGGVVTFVNNSALPVTFYSVSYTAAYSAADQYGKYLGETLTGTAAGYVLSALILEYEERARW